MNAAEFVHLNGRTLAASNARISVFDRGLLYGDGLFETLRCYSGVPFALERHLERLRASADVLEIPVPKMDWRSAIATLVQRNRLMRGDAWVRITLTRGPGARGLEPPRAPTPTVLIATGRVDPVIAVRQRRGMRLMPLPFGRDALLAVHKTLNYLPGILAKIAAADAGADDALFVDPRGRILETPTANVFAWRDGDLWTPRAGILPGVTRALIIKSTREQGIRVRERGVSIGELESADEAFLTSSLAEVVPIVAVGEAVIGNGRRGPRTRATQLAYGALRRSAGARA